MQQVDNQEKNELTQQEIENIINNNEQINGYYLIQNLSNNGMGKTYRCIKKNEQYVIKIMNEQNSKNARSQIDSLKKLNQNKSNFILEIIDTFMYNNQFCFITKYYDNSQTLFSYIRNQPNKRIEQNKALEIFRQILSGLIDMHESSILHRNLKVENILINKNDQIKICGLGISRELDIDDMTWSLCGTPTYSSPEILQGLMYNYKSDIWSLGVLLFAMTTGQLPFGSNNSKRALYQKVKQTLLPVFTFNNVKKNLKYPEKLDFEGNNKEWESLFRLFFEERPNKRATYDQILNHNLIRPLLTVELPTLFNRKFDKLDEILQSVQFNNEQDITNNNEDTRSEQSFQQNNLEEQDLQQMLQSKMLVSKMTFINDNKQYDFSSHINIYNFEIYKYQILIDSYNYFQQKRLLVTLPTNETILLQYFLAQHILYHSLWIYHILNKNVNQFKLDNFIEFTKSDIYKNLMNLVQEDIKRFEDELERLFNIIKECGLEKKLPEEVQAAFVDYIFIDFNNIEYQKLPDFFKLPYRAVLMNSFQKIYLKSQRFLSLQEKVEDLMKEGKNDKDKRREFSINEGQSYLRFALRLLICCLINRVFNQQTCTLNQIRHLNNKNNQFDLTIFLHSLTLASQRASTQTINQLFKSYFPQFNLSNLAKEKFL